MTLLLRGLVALGAAGTVAVAPTAVSLISLVADPTSLEVECGLRGPGAPGEVVIHLLDKTAPPHGHLTVKAKKLDPEERASAGADWVRIESTVGGSPFMCETKAAGHFNVHGTAARLTKSSLTVVTMHPVLVKLQDVGGKVLASRLIDPESRKSAALGW